MSDQKKIVSVIIPAFNEENGVGKVLSDLPKQLIDEIIVVNNNSNDDTSLVAKEGGAMVLDEPRPGYGRACLKGMAYLKKKEVQSDIVVFLDADYSDHPEQLADIIEPIRSNKADLVIGSRALGVREKGSMTIPQIVGNWLATKMIFVMYKKKFTDLGPFRAIKYSSLLALNMQDTNYGWTVEMQVKAVKMKMSCVEVPVDYRRRIGFSKVSGTIKGTIMAGYKIITTIIKYM